eukprot:7493038-Heterocapsa_arctica.AAC.1
MGRPSLRFQGNAVPLYECSNLYYLPVSLWGEKFSPECRRQLQDATAAVRQDLDLIAPSAKGWRFYEYCCDNESILSLWCLRHGIEA